MLRNSNTSIMDTEEKNNQIIRDTENEINAEKADINDTAKQADEGFKTGKKSHGLTWEAPMDEQTFEGERLTDENERSE